MDFEGFESASFSQPPQSSATPVSEGPPLDDMDALFGQAAGTSAASVSTPSTEKDLDAGFAGLGLEMPASSARDDQFFSSMQNNSTEESGRKQALAIDQPFSSVPHGSAPSGIVSQEEIFRGSSPAGPGMFAIGDEEEVGLGENRILTSVNGISEPTSSRPESQFADDLPADEPTPLEKWRAEKQVQLDALEREEAKELEVRRGAAKKWLADWEKEHMESLERTKHANRAKAAAVEHGVYPKGGSTPGDKVPWRSARDMVEELYRRKVMRERQQRSFITTDNNRVELPEDMAKTVGLLAKLAIKQERKRDQ